MILTCYYDLRYQPNTFDFVIFLVGANAYGELIKATVSLLKSFVQNIEKSQLERHYTTTMKRHGEHTICCKGYRIFCQNFILSLGLKNPLN